MEAAMKSVNPADNRLIQEYEEYTPTQTSQIIERTAERWQSWKETAFGERAVLMRQASDTLLAEREECARLISLEMGKLIGEARAEVEKCALVCRYYADEAEGMLKDEIIKTEYAKSFAAFQPLGVILAVMPWNFPFWQVWRFIAPALMAGNAAVLKHASNVSGCALKIEEIIQKAGFPSDIFRTLLLSASSVADVINNPLIKGATLTGSESAGSKVAELAGKNLKKTVLELGGSDPYIVLEDADMERCVEIAVKSRLGNCGQTCIAAKRFIVVDQVAGEFEERMKKIMKSLIIGDPLDEKTQLAPLARPDLLEEISKQVNKSLQMGARLVAGGKKLKRPGNFYLPTILSDVKKGTPFYDEETFGPAAAIIIVKNEDEAAIVANDSNYGLGGSIWTKDAERGERLARRIETGTIVVNNMTVSHPKLPFGGIKLSGYGRELSHYGIKEFVNIKTICVQ